MIKAHTTFAARARKTVPLTDLIPGIGARNGFKYEGEYPIFAEKGELTPELDTHYVFPDEQTLDALAIVEKPQRNRIYMAGYSGTGKTSFWFNLAAICNAEVMEWNADAFQNRGSLVGRRLVTNGETHFQYGILPAAMRRGVWLIINEFDTMSPLAVNIIKPVLEDPPRLTILENDNEVIHAHPDFRVIAIGNTWSRGDNTGMFVNTHRQSVADARRWSARIRLDYMSKADEVAVLRGYFDQVPEETCANFVDVAAKIRTAYKEGKIDITFSTGELVVWVENWLTCGKTVHHAARLSFLESLEPSVQTAIGEFINAKFGHETR